MDQHAYQTKTGDDPCRPDEMFLTWCPLPSSVFVVQRDRPWPFYSVWQASASLRFTVGLQWDDTTRMLWRSKVRVEQVVRFDHAGV